MIRKISFAISGGIVFAYTLNIIIRIMKQQSKQKYSPAFERLGLCIALLLIPWACTINSNSDNDVSISLLSPEGEEVVTANDYYIIEWESSDASDVVKLFYSVDGQSTWHYIGMDDNDGTFDWYVPNSPTNDAFIKVEDNADQSVYGINDESFTISNLGLDEIHVSYPNGGETFTGDSPVTILWESSSSDSAMMVFYYSTDNGNNWNLIGYNPNSGNYSWIVPDIQSVQCLVKIQSYNDPDVVDNSDAVFTIESGGGSNTGLTVTYPNGGEQFNFNYSVNITWASSGDVSSQVNLSYSSDNGSSYTTIATTDNDGSYSWTTPSVESDLYLVKITDAENGSIYDISNSVFSIVSEQVPEMDSIYYDLYDDLNVNVSYTGLGIEAPFFARMKFTPVSSFILTHVRAAYRTEESANTISLYVQSVSTNEILYQAPLSGSDYLSAEGDFFLLPLSTPIAFSANEDFYVILGFHDVNYPVLMSDDGFNGHAGRSSYSDDGNSWLQLEDALGDGNDDAWVIRALQMEDRNTQQVLSGYSNLRHLTDTTNKLKYGRSFGKKYDKRFNNR